MQQARVEAMNNEMISAIEKALLAMKRIYQAGYDRIIECGVACDSPEYMMEGDPTARELRALLAKPAAQHQGEPVAYQARHSESEPWFFTDKPEYWEWRPLYTRPAEQPEPISSTSDKYKAELYDEVWQLARDMGFGNVTDALMKLQSQLQGKKPRKEHICTPVAKTELS